MLRKMVERQQRNRLRALREDRHLARFVIAGRATGKQLGAGSYGSVEEVCCIYVAENCKVYAAAILCICTKLLGRSEWSSMRWKEDPRCSH